MKALSVFTIIYGGSIISLHVLLRVGFFCFLSSYFVFAGGSSSLAVVPPQEDIKELVEAAESNDLKGLGESNVDVLEAAESLVAKSDFSKRTRRRRYTNCKLQVASCKLQVASCVALQVKSVVL